MPARYQELLTTLRQAFPQPVSDPVHDGYVVFSLLRTLDRVDALKTKAPILGSPTEPDYEAALASAIPAECHSTEEVIPELVRYLEGMLIWGHPRSQMNVVAYPSIASIIGVVLPSMYNPNLCSDESGRKFSEAEVRVAAMIARLLNCNPEQVGGLFTFGGTGTLLYGLKVGLEKAFPGAFHTGMWRNKTRPVIVASEHSHYACLNVAGWLGIGQENVIRVPTHSDNSIDLEKLEDALRRLLDEEARIAAIVATMGSTDAFGIDDLQAMHAMRDRLVEEYKLDYVPHLHADSVIGWAWAVFTGYDFKANPLGFRGRTLRAIAATQRRMQHLHLADSLGVDFHKTGFTPYISSLFLMKQRDEFKPIVRDRASMPYLFHSGTYHPGMFSLETSRSATGPMAALANLLLLGIEGFRSLLGHSIEMAELLREQIAARPELTVANEENFGPVTLFRAYPRNVDTFVIKRRERTDESFRGQLQRYNEFNRRVYQIVHDRALEGHGVAIGFTDSYRLTDYGEPVVALKSYVLSPFAEAEQMTSVIEHVLAAQAEVEQEMGFDKE